MKNYYYALASLSAAWLLLAEPVRAASLVLDGNGDVTAINSLEVDGFGAFDVTFESGSAGSGFTSPANPAIFEIVDRLEAVSNAIADALGTDKGIAESSSGGARRDGFLIPVYEIDTSVGAIISVVGDLDPRRSVDSVLTPFGSPTIYPQSSFGSAFDINALENKFSTKIIPPGFDVTSLDFCGGKPNSLSDGTPLGSPCLSFARIETVKTPPTPVPEPMVGLGSLVAVGIGMGITRRARRH